MEYRAVFETRNNEEQPYTKRFLSENKSSKDMQGLLNTEKGLWGKRLEQR